MKYLVPINCPVLTFSSVITLYPQKALEYVAKGLGEQWVHLSWGSGQVAEAPKRLIETGPSGSPQPDAVKWQPLWALSARFMLSDAGSSAYFLPSHAFTDQLSWLPSSFTSLHQTQWQSCVSRSYP